MALLKKKKSAKIGLLGGTFDPVHNGHLAIALEARKKLNLDEFLLIPSALPPHKKSYNISSFTDRANMLELAIGSLTEQEKETDFIVSLIEAERTRPSYTIDTLIELRKRLGPKVSFYFIIGADAFVEIETWKSYQKLLSESSFAVITRPTCHTKEIAEVIERCFGDYRFDPADKNWSSPDRIGEIHLLEMDPIEISSTQIREMVGSGMSVASFVPAGVEQYIHRHGLYKWHLE